MIGLLTSRAAAPSRLKHDPTFKESRSSYPTSGVQTP